MYEVWSARGFEGRAGTDEAAADKAANDFSKRARLQVELRDEDGSVVARHFNGRRVVRKVAGFQSANAEPVLTTVPFTPRPARKVGFGIAA